MTPRANEPRSPLSELDMPMYTSAEASRFINLNPTRVRRWLSGYGYEYRENIRHQRPVIHRKATEGSSYASFLDLIDLLFVKGFLDHGLSLQRVRKALCEAEEILGTNHFARESFFTDGRDIYLQVRKKGDAILQLLSNGQWVIPKIIRQLARQIEFDRTTGIARRWYPKGREGLIVLDPLVSFGRPILSTKRITTLNIYDFFIAEKSSIRAVCSWMSLSEEEAEAAIYFEKELAA